MNGSLTEKTTCGLLSVGTRVFADQLAGQCSGTVLEYEMTCTDS